MEKQLGTFILLNIITKINKLNTYYYFSSHIMGTFYRTIRLLDNGIKPVYVFDGKPPKMKSSELEKRADKRQEAQKALEKAEELGIT
jgi:5'-3' exonuclease